MGFGRKEKRASNSWKLHGSDGWNERGENLAEMWGGRVWDTPALLNQENVATIAAVASERVTVESGAPELAVGEVSGAGGRRRGELGTDMS